MELLLGPRGTVPAEGRALNVEDGDDDDHESIKRIASSTNGDKIRIKSLVANAPTRLSLSLIPAAKRGRNREDLA